MEITHSFYYEMDLSHLSTPSSILISKEILPRIP